MNGGVTGEVTKRELCQEGIWRNLPFSNPYHAEHVLLHAAYSNYITIKGKKNPSGKKKNSIRKQKFHFFQKFLILLSALREFHLDVMIDLRIWVYFSISNVLSRSFLAQKLAKLKMSDLFTSRMSLSSKCAGFFFININRLTYMPSKGSYNFFFFFSCRTCKLAIWLSLLTTLNILINWLIDWQLLSAEKMALICGKCRITWKFYFAIIFAPTGVSYFQVYNKIDHCRELVRTSYWSSLLNIASWRVLFTNPEKEQT